MTPSITTAGYTILFLIIIVSLFFYFTSASAPPQRTGPSKSRKPSDWSQHMFFPDKLDSTNYPLFGGSSSKIARANQAVLCSSISHQRQWPCRKYRLQPIPWTTMPSLRGSSAAL